MRKYLFIAIFLCSFLFVHVQSFAATDPFAAAQSDDSFGHKEQRIPKSLIKVSDLKIKDIDMLNNFLAKEIKYHKTCAENFEKYAEIGKEKYREYLEIVYSYGTDYQAGVSVAINTANRRGEPDIFKGLPETFSLKDFLYILKLRTYYDAEQYLFKATKERQISYYYSMALNVFNRFHINDISNLVGYRLKYNSMLNEAKRIVKEGTRMSNIDSAITDSGMRLGATPIDLSDTRRKGDIIYNRGMEKYYLAENYLTISNLILEFLSSKRTVMKFADKSGRSFEGYLIKEVGDSVIIIGSDKKNVYKINKENLSEETKDRIASFFSTKS